MSKFLKENQLWAEEFDKENKFEEKELYLNVKRYLVREFNNALQENRIDQANEFKKMIEKLEMKYRENDISAVEKFGGAIIGNSKETEADMFEEEIKRKSKEANEEAPNDPNSEFIPERELKDGEIKVNSLPI